MENVVRVMVTLPVQMVNAVVNMVGVVLLVPTVIMDVNLNLVNVMVRPMPPPPLKQKQQLQLKQKQLQLQLLQKRIPLQLLIQFLAIIVVV
jgi:hypothetical protein